MSSLWNIPTKSQLKKWTNQEIIDALKDASCEGVMGEEDADYYNNLMQEAAKRIK